MRDDYPAIDYLIGILVVVFIVLCVWVSGCVAPPSQWDESQLVQYANGCDAGYQSACIALQAGFNANLAAQQQSDYDYQARQARIQNFYLANQASREADFNNVTSQLNAETR